MADVLKYGSLFTGIGGFDLGFDRAGMECSWQVEIDEACIKVLDKHWPKVEKHKDVKRVGKYNLSAVDVICGGFPCQDLSVAGNRAGLAGKRSGLWFEFRRVIAELSQQWVVIENVPGLLSSRGGRDFAVVIQGLVELGYGVCWRVLDAQYFGVPQRRRRVFIVASLGDGRAAKVLFESEGLPGDTPPSREKGQEVAATVIERIGKGGFTDPVNDNIMAVPTLRGFGHGWQGQHNDTNAITFQLTGNRDDTSISTYDDIAPTLPANPMSERGAAVMWEMSHASEAVRMSGDISPTLQQRMGTGGNQVPLVGVRRLTPTECERLQGFPDGWTIGSDSTRYRQLGNAVAVPCSEWIGRRILEANGK